jgi:hypothetical protein
MRAAVMAGAEGCPKGIVLERLARIDTLLVETAAAYYEACPMSQTRYGQPVGLA